MPPVPRGGVRRPIAPHIPVYCPPRVTADAADRVVFLDDLLAFDVHYLTRTVDRKERSVPCDGEGCPLCEEHLRKRVNFYAPAVVHKHLDLEPDGRASWSRVVYYVPEDAAESFQPPSRGRMYRVWRSLIGNSWRLRSQFEGRCEELSEPAFSVLPVLSHVWGPSEETKASLAALLASLPRAVTPPQLRRPEPPPIVGGKEDAELMRRMLDQFKANGFRLITSDPNAPPAGVTPEEWKQATTRTGTLVCDEIKAKRNAKKGGAA